MSPRTLITMPRLSRRRFTHLSEVVLVVGGALLASGAPTADAQPPPVNDSYGLAVLSDNPLGYWRLDEKSGVTAYDSSSNARHGNYIGNVMLDSPGAFPGGNAASATLDGSSGYITLPGLWGSGKTITIEAWVRATPSTTIQAIVSSAISNSFCHFQLAPQSAAHVGCYNSGNYLFAPIAIDKWQHIVMSVGNPPPVGETRTYSKLYINGALVQSAADTGSDIRSGSATIGRGYRRSRYLNGSIDEVAIYGTALSEERIQAHYEASLGAIPPDTSITSQPDDPSNTVNAILEFTGTDDVSMPSDLTFECQLDSNDFSSCTSPQNYSDLADGNHTFSVRATDAANNTDPTPATVTWLVDRTPPNTDITGQPGVVSSKSTASFNFTGTDEFSAPSNLNFECQLDQANFSPCTSPKIYNGLMDGNHTFGVRAIDEANNTDPTASMVLWLVDTTPPLVETMDYQVFSTVNVTINYTAPEVTDLLDADPMVNCQPPSGSEFAVGETNVTCTATDAAGNTGQDTFVVSVLTTDAVIEDTVEAVENLKTNATEEVIFHLEKAQLRLNKALVKNNVERTLKRMSGAVKKLMKAGSQGAETNSLIADLVESARTAAQDAINAALPGRNVDKAEREMEKAQEDLNINSFDKAIIHYAKAWDLVAGA